MPLANQMTCTPSAQGPALGIDTGCNSAERYKDGRILTHLDGQTMWGNMSLTSTAAGTLSLRRLARISSSGDGTTAALSIH